MKYIYVLLPEYKQQDMTHFQTIINAMQLYLCDVDAIRASKEYGENYRVEIFSVDTENDMQIYKSTDCYYKNGQLIEPYKNF